MSTDVEEGKQMGTHGTGGDQRDGHKDEEKQGTFVDPLKDDKDNGK